MSCFDVNLKLILKWKPIAVVNRRLYMLGFEHIENSCGYIQSSFWK